MATKNGYTDFIGLYIIFRGNKHDGITSVYTVRFNDGGDTKQEYLPLFTDKWAAKRFIKLMKEENVGITQLTEKVISYTIQMCKEENYIPAIDIHKSDDGLYEFNQVDLSGN